MSRTDDHQKSCRLTQAVQGELKREYESDLVGQLRGSGNTITRGEITIRLAEAFGFCWGVDRAVSAAHEARRRFPDRQIWITNEIIHNPLVNEKLRKLAIKFVDISQDGYKDFSEISASHVVIVPAFGASVQEMQLLEQIGCQIVDTTCPWVSRVWQRVNKYKQQGFTAIIHGKYKHEETVATASRAENYLIIQNLDEAEWVCSYILGSSSKKEFLRKFTLAYSHGFDPDLHLNRLGITNQTTMLKGETERIGALFQQTLLKRYGQDSLSQHFLSPGDTICDATQERQDAMIKLVAENLDLILVIGGYNSSNTGHLFDIAAGISLPSYHIDGQSCIGPGNRISHKSVGKPAEQTTEPWLPAGTLTIGITSGASTPDQVVAGVIENIFAIRAGR